MLAYVDEYGNLTTTPPKPAGSEDNAASGKRSDRYERGPADKAAHQGIVEFLILKKDLVLSLIVNLRKNILSRQ
jgi:hypothetical protein